MNTFYNHSGGALGADSQWDIIGREYGFNNHNHYWYEKPNPLSKKEDEITEEEYQEGILNIHKANKILKRTNIDNYMHLLARNWMQVKNAETIYAIGVIKNNKVSGGTGWSIIMAIDNHKEVYVYDQTIKNWFYWNDDKFIICNTPILTKHYAGIGTREINKFGIQAIKNTYLKTKKYFKNI